VAQNLKKKDQKSTPYPDQEPAGNNQPSLIFLSCKKVQAYFLPNGG